jgi:ribosomal protein S15P/S13E
MSEKKDLSLTWGQYFNFTEKEILTATENVIVIKNKILQLHEKLEKYKKDFKNGEYEEEKKKIKSQMDRLEMSKECIKYYYKLEIML